MINLKALKTLDKLERTLKNYGRWLEQMDFNEAVELESKKKVAQEVADKKIAQIEDQIVLYETQLNRLPDDREANKAGLLTAIEEWLAKLNAKVQAGDYSLVPTEIKQPFGQMEGQIRTYEAAIPKSIKALERQRAQVKADLAKLMAQ